MMDDAGLLRVAQTVAVEAGVLVRDERAVDLGVDTKSSEVDVVTVMDRRSEDLLRARLAELTPGIPVLGEEAGRGAGSGELTWVVDPIDGTVNYLYGLPDYCVSVAVVAGDPSVPGGWEPVAGAVYQPATRRLFRAQRGGGAQVLAGVDRGPVPDAAGTPLRVHVPADLEHTLVATGFSYSAAVRAEQAAVLAALLPRVRDIRRRGSAALDLCAVAEGTVDCYYERETHVWDVAAGTLIAREAGAEVHGVEPMAPAEALVLAGAAATLERVSPFVR